MHSRPALTEHGIQSLFFQLIKGQKEFENIYAIPNGGLRHIGVAAKLKKEGVKRGIPDVFFACMRGGYGGLYIEFKRPNGKVSPEQASWMERLTRAGYLCAICYSPEQAFKLCKDYLLNRFNVL